MKVEFKQENGQNELEFVWTIRNFCLTDYFSREDSILRKNGAQVQGHLKPHLRMSGKENTWTPHHQGQFKLEASIFNASSENTLIVESEVMIIDESNNVSCLGKTNKEEIPLLKTLCSKIDRIVRAYNMIQLLNSNVIYIKYTMKYEVKFNFQLTNHLSKLMEDGIFSDVVIKMADGSRFPAHKCILARSPVFTAMFSHDLKENRESTVVIEDVQANVLRSLLQYMYTGLCDADRRDDMEELLVAADKYALEDLKAKCEIKLLEKINLDNAVDRFRLAERHNAQLLKERTRAFILSDMKNILKTKSMRSLARDEPSLFYQLVEDSYDR